MSNRMVSITITPSHGLVGFLPIDADGERIWLIQASTDKSQWLQFGDGAATQILEAMIEYVDGWIDIDTPLFPGMFVIYGDWYSEIDFPVAFMNEPITYSDTEYVVGIYSIGLMWGEYNDIKYARLGVINAMILTGDPDVAIYTREEWNRGVSTLVA